MNPENRGAAFRKTGGGDKIGKERGHEKKRRVAKWIWQGVMGGDKVSATRSKGSPKNRWKQGATVHFLRGIPRILPGIEKN